MEIRSHILVQNVTPDCNTLPELYENVTLECVRARQSIIWQTGAHSAYKREMKLMTRRQWATLSALRGGHVRLNGELKYGSSTVECTQPLCVGSGRETMFHFIFRCMQFTERRLRMERLVHSEYCKVKMSWNSETEEKRWQMLLFPLQAMMSRTRDEDELDRLMAIRKEVLFSLIDFVVATERLGKEKEDRGYYEILTRQ